MFEDHIFGALILPEQRLEQHRQQVLGVKHLNRLLPADPAPGQPISMVLTTSGPLPLDRARCWFTTDDRDPAGEQAAVLDLSPAGAAWDTVNWAYTRRWTCQLPAQPAGTMLRYHLAAGVTGSDRWVFADNQAASAAEATDFAVWIDHDPAPAWARSAMVYHVFVDRFYPGDGKLWLRPKTLSGFFGGTLHGVIDKLDYIHELGLNAIWLSPVFASPSHHGYDAIDLYTVEPRLGTNADLKELIDGAHARGMRVILDFVANHWSYLHPTFQSALANPNSPYHDWYIWNHWPDDYETYFGVKELPQLNLIPGPARDALLQAASYWLAQGVDGYRLDFAYGPPHDFWSDFRRACRAMNPDCWLFGEIIQSAAVQLSYMGRLDGTLDFLLARALRETFAHETWDLAEFESFLAAHEAYFPPSFTRPAFLDNHDMNRFLFIAGEDKARLKLAALILFTLFGPPIIYYGTEAGVTQERPIHQNEFGIFEEARLPMKWGAESDRELIRYFQRLVALRRDYPVLHRGARRAVHLDASAGTYAYLRESGPSRILVALNASAIPRTISVARSGLPADAADHLNRHAMRIRGDRLEIDLLERSGAFIA